MRECNGSMICEHQGFMNGLVAALHTGMHMAHREVFPKRMAFDMEYIPNADLTRNLGVKDTAIVLLLRTYVIFLILPI